MTARSVYFQLKRATTHTSSGYECIGTMGEVSLDYNSTIAGLKEAIKIASGSHLENVPPIDMRLYQGDNELLAFNTLNDIIKHDIVNNMLTNPVEVRYASPGKI